MAANGYDILISDINKMMQNDRVGLAAVNTVMASQKKRIFQDGKASNESSIGQYSTNPISISRKNQAKNTGKTYFKGGYREYKSLLGKGTNVNLRNTDQMMIDLGSSIVGRGEYGIGFNNELNGKKAGWNEEHFGKDIFITSDREDEQFVNVFQYEINKI